MEELCGFRVGDYVRAVDANKKIHFGHVDSFLSDKTGLYLTLENKPNNKGGWTCWVKDGVMMSDCGLGEPLVNLTKQKEAQPTTPKLSNFKVGDSVDVKTLASGWKAGVVMCIHGSCLCVRCLDSNISGRGCVIREDGEERKAFIIDGDAGAEWDRIRLVKQGKSSSTNNNNLTKNFMSSLVKKFQSLLLPEPEKTFRKAGVTNESDALTNEGHELFLAFLLKKHGTEFKTEVVDVLVKEEKEDK